MKEAEEILDALPLPREVAIIRDAAYAKRHNMEEKRHPLAYHCVKQAAITKVMILSNSWRD